MPLTVEYSSMRAEVWSWYWRAWKRRLWRIHLLLFVMTALSVYLQTFTNEPLGIRSVSTIVLVALALVAILPLYPQLRFKPELRTLRIDDVGISTTIGKRSGSVAWGKVQSVTEQGDGYVVIERRNGNAFIVPPRAFESENEREAFLAKAQESLPSQQPL